MTGVTYPQQNAIEARWIDAERMSAGVASVQASGDLQGKPAIVLHGRQDALLPPNHTSRVYFGLNKVVEQEKSRLTYIEVSNANHFDAFIPLFGSNALAPMQHYFTQALDLMHDHLASGAQLPPSQVVAATASHKPWSTLEDCKKDLPDILMEPPPEDCIVFSDGRVEIASA